MDCQLQLDIDRPVSADALWERLLPLLEARVGREGVRTWLGQARPLAYDGRELTLGTASRTARDWIERWQREGRRELLATPSNGGSEGYSPATYVGGKLRPDLTDVDTRNPNYLQESLVPTVGAETHAGEEVGIYATGPRAYLFRGVMEQNAIYHVMADALGF